MGYLLALTVFLAPTYVIKFEVFGLPANLLMLWVFVFWVIFASNLSYKKRWADFFYTSFSINRTLLVAILAFFFAGTFSLFVYGFSTAKLGQFLVLFLQPISLFIIGRFIFLQNPKAKSLLLTTCYLLLALMGVYATLQYFTLIGLPEAYWGNNIEPKRALSIFAHPNFYSLFITPLLAFLLPDAIASLKSKILNLKSLAWIIGAAGLFFSLSRAGWLGLLAAVIAYMIVAADKKMRLAFFALMVVGIIFVFSITNLRYRIILPLLGEKSAISRTSLWQTGFKGIQESPIPGMGLVGFSQNWSRLNTDPNIDSHNYPHNIFLNFWVETGLLGLICFIIISAMIIYRGLRHYVIPEAASAKRGGYPESKTWIPNQTQDNIIRLGISLFFIALITQGLIDNPYFKNDLALIFWIILSLAI